MNKNYHKDSASLAFQPLIDLTFSPFATLSSTASLHWLESNSIPNQWGAFMHFYGPTRKLLKIGGLDLAVENFLHVQSPHMKWHQLIDDYSKGTLDIAAQLHLIRLLFYLGFYKDAISFCRKIASGDFSLENKIWARYLQELGESVNNPINWSPLAFFQEIELLKSEISPFLLFHILLLFAKFFTRNQTDPESSMKCLGEASLLIENSVLSSQLLDANLSRTRLGKYKADFYFRFGEVQKAESILENACYTLDDFLANSKTDPSDSYLYRETKRRLLDRLTLHYKQSGKEQKAFECAKSSILIDPYCSYALLLAGKVGLNIDRDFSVNCFEQAAEYGIIERAYAKQVLSEVQGGFPLISKDLMNEARDGNIFLISKKTSPLKSKAVSLPIEIKPLEEISQSYSENIHWEHMRASAVYHRSLPFWELKPSQYNSPIFCSAPLEALEVFKNKQEPWFETLYLQRAMPMNFREELFFAASPHPLFGIKHQSLAKKLEIIKSRSEISDWLISTYSTIDSLSKLEKILFSRLLGSMGFYKEALNSLPFSEKNSAWSFEDEYAFCTKLFFEHIYFSGTSPFPHQDIEFAFEKLGSHPKSIRMKLMLTILGSVYHGKNKQTAYLKKWRDKGFEALEIFQNSSYFNEFEKKLITSRFYRAVSFYPYLIRDDVTLRKEAEICESYARSLSPKTKKQELLYKENLFPMLESIGRIFAHLGETEKTLNFMEEIVNKVDSCDAKAWIQIGEAREMNGDFEHALTAFQSAIDLGMPLGAIACFRAGRTSEKIGDLKKAKHYYMRSLKFCPKGLSPLQRLNAISKKMGDSYLKNWSEANLNSLKIHFG